MVAIYETAIQNRIDLEPFFVVVVVWVFWVVLGPHPAMLKGYSRLCIQEFLLAVLRDYVRYWGLNLGQRWARKVPTVLDYCSGP